MFDFMELLRIGFFFLFIMLGLIAAIKHYRLPTALAALAAMVIWTWQVLLVFTDVMQVLLVFAGVLPSLFIGLALLRPKVRIRVIHDSDQPPQTSHPPPEEREEALEEREAEEAPLARAFFVSGEDYGADPEATKPLE